ncbi:MAG: CvpA family protein [bacterium]|nr:CvpA family protein [bacterium]
MHLFDIIALVFFLYIVIRGYFRGLLREAFNLFGIFGGGLVAVKLSPGLADIFRNLLGLSYGNSKAAAFSLIWIFIYVLMFFCGMFLQNVVKLMLLEWVDKFGGAALGFLKGFFITGLVVISLMKFPLIPKYREELKKTIIVKPIAVYTPKVYNLIIDIFSWNRFESFDQTLNSDNGAGKNGAVKELGKYNKSIEDFIGE